MGTFGRIAIGGRGQPVVVEETNFGILSDKVFPEVEENKLDTVLRTMGVKVEAGKVFGPDDFVRDDKTRRR